MDHTLKRKRRWAPRIQQYMLMALSCMPITFTKGQNDQQTPTIIAQPAMFGTRWNITPSTYLRTIDFDLCNQTEIEANAENHVFRHSNISSSYSNDCEAFFFDAVGASSECSYADMAQAAQRAFPTAKYLLISRVELLAMTKFEREPETSLSLAAVTLEDAQAIKSGFSSSNATTEPISDGGILVSIDAMSRALIEICNCEKDGNDPVETWSLILRITSTLSIVGSLYIIYTLVGSKEKRTKNLKNLFNRLLIAVSISDLLSSSAIFVGRWAFATTPPGDYEGYYSLELWELENRGGFGTATTCAIEGFIMHLGINGSSLFTSFLAIQTLLVVRYQWKKDKMRKIEYIFFSLGIMMPLIGAITAASIGMLNQFDIGFCWIRKSTAKCDYMHEEEEEVDDDGELEPAEGGPLLDPWCEEVYRGNKAFLIQLGLALIWILLALFICLGSMISLFCFIRQQENRAARWVLTARDGRHQKLVLARALMYFIVFVLVWLPSIVSLALSTEELRYVVVTLMPLQGFLNAIIFSGKVEKLFLKPSPAEVDQSSSYRTSKAKSLKPSKYSADRSIDWSFRSQDR